MPGLEKLPRRERLTKRREYLAMYRNARRIQGKAFICYVARRAGQGRKFGMAVSRKVGGAVVRNRVKRYIREIYRTRRQSMDDDISIVIVARPVSASLDFAQCEDAIGQLLRKGEVLSG